jgi:hypothetical protein
MPAAEELDAYDPEAAVMLPRKLNVTVTEPFESPVDPSISENRNLHSASRQFGA